MGAPTDSAPEAQAPERVKAKREDPPGEEPSAEPASSSSENGALEPDGLPPTPEQVKTEDEMDDEAFATECKKRGNDLFKAKDYNGSIKEYQAGLGRLSGRPMTDPLLVALQSNVAISQTKLKNYYECIDVTSEILKHNPRNPKVFFRRAQAREGAALGGTPPLMGKKLNDMIRGSLEDLATSLEIFDDAEECPSLGPVTPKEHGKMRASSQAAYDRLKKMFPLIGKEVDQSRTDSVSSLVIATENLAVSDTEPASTSGTEESTSSSPDEPLVVMATDSDLDMAADPVPASTLIAESKTAPGNGSDPVPSSSESISASVTKNGKVSPIKSNGKDGAATMDDDDTSKNVLHQPSEKERQKKDVVRLLLARQSASKKSKVVGEAFFLIDWNWWCRWCWYTEFFFPSNAGDVSKNIELLRRANRVLDMLPPGAILPPTTPPSDDDDSSTDSEKSNGKERPPVPPPETIDNSSLIFGDDVDIFHRQWYDIQSIRPNLVRGYHFEILPREVYCAIRSWYSEVSPSICRRTNVQGTIDVYLPRKKPTENSSGHRCGACRAFGAKSRCQRCMLVYYCDRDCQVSHWPYHKGPCKAKTLEAVTLQASFETAGLIGIRNLGNTCFMNSALQCLSHSAPLTRHFLSEKFKKDLNTENPLGTGGELAHAYYVLLKDLWMKPMSSGATAPIALKRAIAKFAPRFAGTLQHDSQEFLAYLLDGLHEDLNRIVSPPYVVLPDVTDGQNMAVASAEAWDAHRRRNDSLVLDTFYGQFKSTCICPKCSRVSVSFDAFNHVSLEIPQPQKSVHFVSLFAFSSPDSGKIDKRPIRYGFLMDKGATIAMLKKKVEMLTGIPAHRSFICEVAENSIVSVYQDNKPVSGLQQSDLIMSYEADQYSDLIYHTVITQSMVVDGRKISGFPLMVSVAVDRTCREIWNQIWSQLDYIAYNPEATPPHIDKDGKYLPSDVLLIRLVTRNEEEVLAFEGGGENTEANAKSSILPHDSDERLFDILGAESAKNFLFLSLEWIAPPSDESEPLVYPDRLGSFIEHPSLSKAVAEYDTKVGSRTVSLDDCFKTFTKPERLDEQNMWYCSRCKEHTRALKTMKLWRLPNILIIHLKRFEFKHALRRDKLDTFVDFPLEGLDMSDHWSRWPATSSAPVFANTDVPALYDLFGCVNHYGRMGFGHYTAFARKWDERSISATWSLFDDSNVQVLPNGRKDVVSPSAYVLFYKRREFN